jgi:RimJ/RimL family protein N-acetyltransferase
LGVQALKIVTAAWEERNLGVTTQEVEIEKTDDENSISSGLKKLYSTYQVVKLPAELIKYSRVLATEGFVFSENMLSLECKMSNYTREVGEYQPMSKIEISDLFDHIDMGMFSNNRIALDSHFTLKQAANRYKNWIQDEINRGGTIVKLENGGRTVGFTGIKIQADGKCFAFLSAIYPEFQGRGLSWLIVDAGLACIKQKENINAKALYTKVSSNNIGSLKSHIGCGYIPIYSDYVYTKFSL